MKRDCSCKQVRRENRRPMALRATLFSLPLLLITLLPKTASDPVLPAQSGQGPASQGTLVSGSVNPFSGTYSTSVPIEVLPGRNGLQPALALSYGSTNVDGLAGVGWNIPASSITRTGPYKAAPTYASSDEFYMTLNGAAVQLMPYNDLQTDGTREFRTRIDSQSKIIAHYHWFVPSYLTGYYSQVAWWEVWSKSGERYYFGPPSDDSNIDQYCLWVPPILGKDEDRHRNQWMLRKVVDTDSNTMEYHYSVPGTNGENGLLPTQILYGGNDVTSYPHFAGVRFIYESRPDSRMSYRNGTQQLLSQRLKEIIAGPYSSGDVSYGPSARHQVLTYAVSRTTGRSLLTRVDIAGKDESGTETPLAQPITFTYSDYAASDPLQWTDGTGPYAEAALRGLAFSEGFFKAGDNNYGGTKSLGSVFMDLNGDGLPDKVDSFYRSNYDGSASPPPNPIEHIYLNPGPGASTWLEVATPSIPGKAIANFYSDRQYQQSNLDTGVRFADVDGDGVPDKIDSGSYTGGQSSSAVYFGKKDGSGWEDTPASSIHPDNNKIFSDPASWLLPSGIGPGGALPPVDLGFPDRRVVPPTMRHGVPLGDKGKGLGELISWVTCDLRITPLPTTAGGQIYFFWEADGLYVPPSGDDQQGASVKYSLTLQNQTPVWGPSQTKTWPGYAVYTSLAPNNYRFHIRAANRGGEQVTKTYDFTVTSTGDNTPPALAFTSTPPVGWLDPALNGVLNFGWTGTDGSSIQYQNWLVPYGGLPSGWTAGASASYTIADPFEGTFLVVGMDQAGNMAAIEWAFGGGRISPPYTNVIWTAGANGTIQCQPQGTVYMDLNGDGYADAGRFYNDGTTTQVAVSLWNPDYFIWEDSPGWGEHAMALVMIDTADPNQDAMDLGTRLVDVNGDGLPDFVRYFDNVAGGSLIKAVRFNTGQGWTDSVIETGSYGDVKGQAFSYRAVQQSLTVTSDVGAWLLDINGDGLPDKVDSWNPTDSTESCGPTRADKGVHLNTGTGFNGVNGLAPYQSSPPGTQIPGYAFSEWFMNTFRSGPKNMASRDTGVRVLDINGDGLPDFVRMQERNVVGGPNNCSASIREVHLAEPQNINSPKLDYLVKIKNPIGGTTEIAYKSANTECIQGVDYCPSIPYVVETVTEGDGQNGLYTTHYDYAHPKWDTVEREFAGFREVKITTPGGQYSQTIYLQDLPYTGMVEETHTFGNDNQPASTTIITYAPSSEDGHDVFSPLRKATERTTRNEQDGSLTTGVDYTYSTDGYYNLTEVKTLGDLNTSSDDRTVRTQYINSELTDRRLIGFVKQVETFDASGTQITSGKQICYDGLAYGLIAKGHATQETNWLDYDTQGKTLSTVNAYITAPTATINYYDEGTIASRRDAMGIQTTFSSYDATHRFPLSKSVHGTSYIYTTTVTTDTWGRPKSVTDAKGVTSSTTYDGLGRETDDYVNYGAGQFHTKHVNYNDSLLGNPSAQFVELITYVPGSSLSTKAYFDGLARTYQATSPGWNGVPVYVETQFDPNGRLDKKSRPHFSSTSPQWVQYGYDPNGRATTETAFGKTTTTDIHTPTLVTVTVAGSGTTGTVSHAKTTQTDAYGRKVMVQQDGMPAVYYQYNNKDALVSAREGLSSGTLLVELTYDAWGRKLSYKDYDAGTLAALTNYYYDHQGRLIQQKEVPNADPLKYRQTDLTYAGDLGQLTSRVGIDDLGGTLSETITYYGANQGLNSGEVYTRDDQSGHYTYSTSLNGTQIRSSSALQTPFVGAPASYGFSTDKDWAGRTVQSTYPSGQSATYEYQASSALPSAVRDGFGSAVATYSTYDETHLTQWQRGNGVTTNYTFDTNDHLTDVNSARGGSSIQGLHYQFQGDGQVSTVTDAAGGFNQNFSYDSSMRLTHATGSNYGTLNYTYDPDSVIAGGPRLLSKGTATLAATHAVTTQTTTLAYDPTYKHRVVSAGTGRTYTYDAWGNVVSETLPDGAVKHYAYDAWNRMTYADTLRSDDGGVTWGGQVAQYTYNAGGERVRSVVFFQLAVHPLAIVPQTFADQVLFINGYEVKQFNGEVGIIRERWAVTGPNGLVAWKQKGVGLSAHLEGVNRRGEGMLAAMAGEKAWNEWVSLGGGGGGGLPCNRGFMGSLGATSVRLATAGKDLLSALRHQGKAFGLDPEAQHDAGLALLGFLGGCAVLLLWSSRARAFVLIFVPKAIYSQAPRLTESPSRLTPLGPWAVPVLRHAARTMVLVFLFPCGMLLTPVPAQAQVCEQMFYPLTDHLGSVSTLTDTTGAVVMTRHFLPFGESFESEEPTVASCNNNEPWP